ncbi:RteC domain-containing protein [Gaoshiqia sediminis]|uniref:RteC domain-containing protein n=1 Tax=Gaoshiqia sediminis TaxID=2986998 RepID=A0AA42CA16_9BACT|nr:RteC domain-containing protein [Gaoshiqia sediminis]MCW0484771.1 RteC domain-containing protein [Gaoshiqia sediminis]
MTAHRRIIEQLDTELARTCEVSDKTEDQLEFAIDHCHLALKRMLEQVIEAGFPDKESEIRFFKEQKPMVYSRLLYYQGILNLEKNCPQSDRKLTRNYYIREMENLIDFLEQNKTRVQYSRSGFTYLDHKYFLLDLPTIPLRIRSFPVKLDDYFNTWHDPAFSTILAYERLVEYIQDQLDLIDYPAE